MSDQPHPTQDTLRASVVERVDKVCNSFEAVWKAAESTGQRPRIEDYLGTRPESERSALLRELIALDIAYRRRAGENPVAEEYCERFPSLDPKQLASILVAQSAAAPHVAPAASDIQMHDSRGAEPPIRTQAIRIRCPHCHNPIQLVDDRPDDVLCPGCGSSFRLREARQTTTAGTMRPLGKFQLLERVGLGAFGAVWRARDTELERIVALKIPHASLLTSEADLERFHREARAAAQLRHPGIVTVHEVQTLEGLPTIVSDFIEGVPLKDLLEVRRLTFREAATLVAEVAEAVDYAHSMELVHRDLKPANIMVDYSGVARPESSKRVEEEASTPTTALEDSGRATQLGKPLVMDFGLALRQEAEITLTLDGQIIGTPAYMSPEQAVGKGHQADRRSDVYSLGVILYELLCGELPFRGSKIMLLHQVVREEPRPPRRLNDKIPRDLETICLKAMAKAPTRRYATARELAEDLRRYLKGEPVQARPVGQGERLWRWCCRNPLVAGLTAAAAGLLLAGTGISTYLWIQADGRAEEARANLYVAHMNRAQVAWQNGHLAQVRQLLDLYQMPQRHQRDLRGWEWYYLQRLHHDGKPPRTLKGHTASVLSVAFSPDGTRLGSAGHDGTVVWDVAGRDGARGEARFVPEEERVPIVVGGVENVRLIAGHGVTDGYTGGCAVKVWDGARVQIARFADPQIRGELNLGRVLARPGSRDKIDSVALTPDGAWMAWAWDGADGDVRLWHAAYKPKKDGILWNAVNGTNPPRALKGHTDSVSSLVFSPDGKRLASASKDNSVRLWDIPSGQQLRILPYGPVHSLAFSPDGARLATAGGDKTVKVWYCASGQELRVLYGHTGSVQCVAFNPDGTRLASGSDDHTVKLWDVASGQELLTLTGHTGSVQSVAFSLDGTRLASGSSDKTVKLWDAKPLTPKVLAEREALAAEREALAVEREVEREALVLVESLFAQLGQKKQVLEAVRKNRTISEPVRQKGLALAEHFLWEGRVRGEKRLAKTALKPTGFATIKGKVIYDGTPPPPADITIPDNHKDRQYCLKAPHMDPTWIVSANNGVKNVVLWVRPPIGKYFEIPTDQQTPVEPTVKIDQPFCAFEPHVAVAFPSYYDGETQTKTGQKLEVANSALIAHNTNWIPLNSILDSGDNVILQPKSAARKIPLFESATAKNKSGLENLLTFRCDIHQWMRAYVWAFDHPYAAITKDDGTYEIKNVPACSELQLVGWHEGRDYFLPGGRTGETIGPLKENEIKVLDFKIRK